MSWTEDDLAAHYARLKVPQQGAAKAAPSDASEALIEAECTKILEEDGWRSLRTDPVSDKSRGKGFGELGMADHLYIRYQPNPRHYTRCDCHVLWVEFKSRNGKPKSHQIDWHIRERAQGGCTLIAGIDFPASIDGFRQWYESSGMKRQLLVTV